MPIAIGEVQSEVSVDPERGAGGGEEKPVLPRAEETGRWEVLSRRVAWDCVRTAACDLDD